MVNRQTASFLFSDVKGYSQIKEAEIKYFFEILIPKLVEEVIKPYRQNLRDINTWGDGLIVVADDPYSLAKLALNLRDFYNQYSWDEERMTRLIVRISLHHGAIYTGHDPIRDRDGVIGTEITLGARVEPIVEPGEIWCTRQFRDLIKGDSHLVFDDLGMKELAKNFGSIETYRLRRHTDNPTDNPKK
jgi:class 3 adenylate cyclase